MYLDDINKNVDGGVDCEHEVVPPGENLSPCWPICQVPIVDHLISLITAGDELAGVTEKEDDNNSRKKCGHCGITSLSRG